MSESPLLTNVTLSSQVKNHILNLIAEQKLTRVCQSPVKSS